MIKVVAMGKGIAEGNRNAVIKVVAVGKEIAVLKAGSHLLVMLILEGSLAYRNLTTSVFIFHYMPSPPL